MATPATSDEVLALIAEEKRLKDEREQQSLASMGLGAPAVVPPLASSTNTSAPELPAFSTPAPVTPAPTLGDGQVSAANELLGNTGRDTALGSAAGTPVEPVSPAVAATSQAADQTNASIQAAAEPTGAAFAEAVFGDAKPPQAATNTQAPVDPNAAARQGVFDEGVAALNEASKIEMGLAKRDDRHLNKKTGEMDPGGNGILDEEEMAAHVSSITSAWTEAEEGIKARVALDYKNNLEKLQEEQHRIKADYSAMMDEVANTYINPAELWDKGGFGARAGIPGAAFLDTLFAMKGWNVPSFSAQWDKAVEGNVIAQKSKLAQKEGKLDGFRRLWDMAGQIATNEREQIGYTSDLLKAVTMGQYVHQLAPFKSLAAAKDAQSLKAQAMREIGKLMINSHNIMEQNALKSKAQADANALAQLKQQTAAEAQRQRARAHQGGLGVGNSNIASKDLDSSWKHMGTWNPITVTPKDAARHAKMFGQGVPGQQSKVVNKLLGVEKGNWVPVEGIKNGKRTVIGFYDKAANGQGQEDKDVALLGEYLKAPDKLARFNEVYVQAVREAAAEGETGFTAAGFAGQFFSKIKGQPNLTGARAELSSMLARDSLEELHRLSGGAVTADEAVRFNYLMPAILIDKSGAIRSDVNPAMARIAEEIEAQTSRLNQATGSFFPTQAPPADLDSEEGKAWVADRGSAKASLDILAAGMPGTYLQKTDLTKVIDVTRANGQPAVKVDAKDSALKYQRTIAPDGKIIEALETDPEVDAAYLENLKGITPEKMGSKEVEAFNRRKNIPAQSEAEVMRVWTEDKGGWKSVGALMQRSADAASRLRAKAPKEAQAGLQQAIDDLVVLKNEAKVWETKARPGLPADAREWDKLMERNQGKAYDHKIAERPDHTNFRDQLAKEYRAIMAHVYAVEDTQAAENQ